MQKCCLVSGRTITIKVWLLEFSTTRPFDPSTTSLVSSKCLVCCSFIDHSQGLSTQKFAVKSLKMAIHSLKLTASLPRKKCWLEDHPFEFGFRPIFQGANFLTKASTPKQSWPTLPSQVTSLPKVKSTYASWARRINSWHSAVILLMATRNPAITNLRSVAYPVYVQSFIHSRWLFGISEPSTRGQKYVKRHESQNQSPISPQKISHHTQVFLCEKVFLTALVSWRIWTRCCG